MGDATSICTITQIQPISVLFTIPEDTLPQVRQRLKTGATLEVRVLDRSQKTELSVGRLDTHDNAIDITTGTVKLRAVFDNTDENLFPNQFVNVRLLVDTVKDAVVVPVAAIQRGQPGTFVYLAKADDTVAIQVVQLGASDGDKQQILSGLQVGDQVVIDGTDRLRDGAKIRRPGERAAGPPVAAAPPDKTANGPANGRSNGPRGERAAQGDGPGAASGAAAGQPPGDRPPGERPQRRRQANSAGESGRPAQTSE
jgi:multidrug efflux system membrane fusion protein